MKPHYILAPCLCGCNEVQQWLVMARDKKQAKAKFIQSQDKLWPLQVLAVAKSQFALRQEIR